MININISKKTDGPVNPIISVIIPVFNTELYVEECVESVINQQDKYVECIVVDDGSVDGSLSICNNIKARHPELDISIISQINMGLSGARNTGISAARGEYILFLDSDDMLAGGTLKRLLCEIKKSPKADLILFDAVVHNETSSEYNDSAYDRSNKMSEKEMSGEEYFSDWYVGHRVFSACMRLYRAKMLKANRVEFSIGKLHEDISFGVKSILAAQKIKYIPEKLYIRRVRDNSITTIRLGEKHYRGIYTAFDECMDCFMDKYPANRDVKIKLRNSIYRYLCFGMRYIVDTCHLAKGDISESERIFNRIMRYLLQSIQNAGFTLLSAVKQALTIMHDESIGIFDDNLNTLEMSFGCRDIQIILKKLDREVALIRKEILDTLPLDNETLKIGIYGMGYHTTALLEEFCKYKKIRADIFFIESNQPVGNQTIMDRKRYCVNNLPEDTDYYIISSWNYHDEMVIGLKNNVVENATIIDLYETEKAPLY